MTEFPTQDQFRSWLLKKAPDQVISADWSCGSCPLSTFLNEACGFVAASVSPRSWVELTDPNLQGHLPTWAQEFVYWVDHSNPRQVTAEDCLEILHSPFFDPPVWDRGGREPVWVKPKWQAIGERTWVPS